MRSELHPDVEQLLAERREAGRPRNHQLSVEGTRRHGQAARTAAETDAPPVSVSAVRDYRIPGPEGHEQSLSVRAYLPDATEPRPVVLWFHGGGFVRGSLDSNDRKCRFLADRAGCTVVAVDYRRAPEHRFPAALEDCFAATRWAADNAEILAGDADRLAVAGTSAGGNLAAAVALLARDRGGTPAIKHQFLGVPALDLAFDSAPPVVDLPRPRSHEENAEGYGLTRAEMVLNRDLYLRDDIDARHPYASPLRARDLRGLPPAHVITAGFDPLRDDGWGYAERLRDAGVPVTHSNYDAMPHSVTGSTFLRRGVGPTVEAFEEVAAELEKAL